MLHSQVCVVIYFVNLILCPVVLEFGFHKVVTYCTHDASSSGPFHYYVCPQFSLLVHKQKSVVFKYVIVRCCFLRVESCRTFNFFHCHRDSNKTLSIILFKVCLGKDSNCMCSRGMFHARVFTVCFSMVQEQQLIVLTHSEAVILLHTVCYGYLSQL